jgi:hypothetical protein
MKTIMTFPGRRFSRAGFRLFHAIAAGLLLGGPWVENSRADQVLLAAPGNATYYYGMASPFPLGASFTLNNSYNVSMIDVLLRTPASTSFTTFDFSLQDAPVNPANVFATANVTAALGAVSTEAMSMNVTLPAGTYYLTCIVPGYAESSGVTPGDVDGWMLSIGTYHGSGGTIDNGVWVGDPAMFDTGGTTVAPAFAVYGTPTPEPAAWTMLAAGTASLLALRRRRHGASSQPRETG